MSDDQKFLILAGELDKAGVPWAVESVIEGPQIEYRATLNGEGLEVANTQRTKFEALSRACLEFKWQEFFGMPGGVARILRRKAENRWADSGS